MSKRFMKASDIFGVPSEDEEQMAVVEWARLQMGRWPELEWLCHIPNGGKRGNSSQSIQEGETSAIHAAGGSSRGDGDGRIGAFHLQQEPICGSISPCIGGQHQATVGIFMGGQGEKAGGIGYSERVAPALRSAASGSNRTPDVVYGIDQQGGKGNANYTENVIPTMRSDSHGTPHGVAFAAGFNDSVGERAQGGMEYSEERSPALRSGDVRAVVYDARGNGAGGWPRR